MKEQLSIYFHKLLADLVATETSFVLFVTLIICIVIVLDATYTFTRKKRRSVGIAKEHEKISDIIKTQKVLPGQHYLSPLQGLAGKPDALIVENGYVIPVERKPLAKKLRDRYIAQLLVYMRLIEEFEGKRPPYGYLILGRKCRRVKISNTPQRQAWLQTFIDEMHAILTHEAKTIPSPHPQKCNFCSTRNACDFSMGSRLEKQIAKKKLNIV